MKNKFIQKISLGAALLLLTSNTTFAQAPEQSYTPTPENMKARQEFQDNKFGIFLHWHDRTRRMVYDHPQYPPR
jgi:alpha-L-fucosidase